MYAIGEIYVVKSLKTVAKDKFEATLYNTINRDFLRRNCLKIEHLIDVIEVISTTTPELDIGLPGQVLSYCASTESSLKSSLELEAFKNVLLKFPDFAYWLLVRTGTSFRTFFYLFRTTKGVIECMEGKSEFTSSNGFQRFDSIFFPQTTHARMNILRRWRLLFENMVEVDFIVKGVKVFDDLEHRILFG